MKKIVKYFAFVSLIVFLTASSCKKPKEPEEKLPTGENTMYFYYGATAHHSRNLGIGHSMGGLMIREADRLTANQPKNFGGYITVTTPNYGAPIANSLMDGSVENAAEDACNKIVDGPASEFFGLPWVIVPNLATDYLCDSFIDNDLVQNLIGTPTTSADLRVGSPTIDAINNYTDNINPNIPRISIWAEENSPVHWRMFSSDLYDNDITLVNQVHSARSVYNTFYIVNLTIGTGCLVGGFWNPYCWGASALGFYKASQWKKGRNWIDDSENIWCSLIKTTRREVHTHWEYIYPCDDYDPWYDDDLPDDCSPYWGYVTEIVSVNYPSDGLLPKYTQCLQGLPNNDGTRYKVNGANHLEVRDMSAGSVDETAIEFRKIFNRSDWFHTN